jgi:xanthine dehydrogenase accessory factor
MTESELARLSSPIGLDLGARTPEETAISVAAEIIQLRWGGHGTRLSELRGPIHHHGTSSEDVGAAGVPVATGAAGGRRLDSRP